MYIFVNARDLPAALKNHWKCSNWWRIQTLPNSGELPNKDMGKYISNDIIVFFLFFFFLSYLLKKCFVCHVLITIMNEWMNECLRNLLFLTIWHTRKWHTRNYIPLHNNICINVEGSSLLSLDAIMLQSTILDARGLEFLAAFNPRYQSAYLMSLTAFLTSIKLTHRSWVRCLFS
jgi:hypothetical protein